MDAKEQRAWKWLIRYATELEETTEALSAEIVEQRREIADLKRRISEASKA